MHRSWPIPKVDGALWPQPMVPRLGEWGALWGGWHLPQQEMVTFEGKQREHPLEELQQMALMTGSRRS